MKHVTDTTYIYIFKQFLKHYLLIGVTWLYLYTYLSDCFNFPKIDGEGWGWVLSSGRDGTYHMT